MTPQYKQTDLDFILKSLYEIDPTLKGHEADLKKLLSKLVDARPEVKIDSKFVTELRRELLSRPAHVSWFEKTFTHMNKIPFYAGGAITIALVALIGYNVVSDKSPSSDTMNLALGDTSSVTGLAPGAFGNLGGIVASQDSALGASAESTSAPSAVSRPQSGGGGGGDLGITTDGKMIAPGEPYPSYNVYTLKYAGGDFEISTDTNDVYRRVHSTQTTARLGALMSGQNNGILDLSAFGSMNLTGYQLVQSANDGYMLNVDLQNSLVFINRSYLNGYVEQGYDRNLTENDIPPNEKLIATASGFLKKYGLDISTYGEPFVQDDWRRTTSLELLRDASAQVWYPHTINVIFPMVIDGTVVHDQSGNPYGVIVSVNIVDNTVTSAYNIGARNYEKSAYKLETDMKRIVSFAERGGLYGFWLGSEKGGTITLGTPELVGMYMSQWNEQKGENMELIVPAMRFALLDPPAEAAYGPRYILVPLVKEILDTYDRGPDVDPPTAMPLTEPAVMGMPVPEMEGVPEMEVIELK